MATATRPALAPPGGGMHMRVRPHPQRRRASPGGARAADACLEDGTTRSKTRLAAAAA